MKRRICSFVFGGLSAVLFTVIGIYDAVNTGDAGNLGIFFAIALSAFTFVSCLILDNNFIIDAFIEILSWSLVKFPGLIFSFDLDGCLWFIGMKILFAVLGFILGLLCLLLALAVGAFLSIFVYPYALYKNIKHGE